MYLCQTLKESGHKIICKVAGGYYLSKNVTASFWEKGNCWQQNHTIIIDGKPHQFIFNIDMKAAQAVASFCSISIAGRVKEQKKAHGPVTHQLIADAGKAEELYSIDELDVPRS